MCESKDELPHGHTTIACMHIDIAIHNEVVNFSYPAWLSCEEIVKTTFQKITSYMVASWIRKNSLYLKHFFPHCTATIQQCSVMTQPSIVDTNVCSSKLWLYCTHHWQDVFLLANITLHGYQLASCWTELLR